MAIELRDSTDGSTTINEYKILVVGSNMVGKTSIIRKYTKNKNIEDYKSTLGVEFSRRKVVLRDQMITLNFWDIGGQNIFTRLTSTYYKSALGAIVVCDITDPTSLSGAERWKKDVNEKVKFKGKDIPCILFVNKIDLLGSGNIERKAQLDKYVKDHGFIGWVATSAKTKAGLDVGVCKIVTEITKFLVANSTETSPLAFYPEKKPKQKKRGCSLF